MRIGYVIYEVTSKRLKDIIDQIFQEKGQMLQAAKKFARKVGANPHCSQVWKRDGGAVIAGLYFDNQAPDPKEWKRVEHNIFRPKKKTALYKEFEAIPSYSAKKLADAVGWKNIYHDCRYYEINWFHYPNGFCGIQVPVFDAKSMKNDPSIVYNPVRGLREIKLSTFNKKAGEVHENPSPRKRRPKPPRKRGAQRGEASNRAS